MCEIAPFEILYVKGIIKNKRKFDRLQQFSEKFNAERL